MFGTLHWKADTNEAEFIERPHASSDPERNAACDRCRAKKVKCDTHSDGCSRCTSLQKPCTFTSIIPRSEHKRRKANKDYSQKEIILDIGTQSSIPSGFRGTEQMSDLYVDHHPVDHDLSTSTQGYETGRDLRIFEGALVNTSTATSPKPDLSFLDELDDQTRDQFRDDIVNLQISSGPFYSSNTHNTHFDQTKSSAFSISENLISPSTSLEDEMLESMTTNRVSQDPSFLYMSPNDTTAFLQTSPPVSTVFPSQSLSKNSCHCLATAIFSVEKFDASCNPGIRSELDSILAQQKEAVKQCQSMLGCSECVVKRERLVMLVFMTEKVVAACGRIVALYWMEDADCRVESMACSTLSRLPSDHQLSSEDCGLATPKPRISASTDNVRSRSVSVTSSETHTPPDWQHLLIGDYEINSLVEWEHLVRVLIFLQLRAIRDLVANIKSVGGEMLGETQTASLVQAQTRVTELEKRIRII